MNLFLDDYRHPKDVTWIEYPCSDWVIVRNYKEFVQKIEKDRVPLFISFDNDLHEEHYEALINGSFQTKQFNNLFFEKTGYDCAVWLIQYCNKKRILFPEYTVHSLNPLGKENIMKAIKDYKMARKSVEDSLKICQGWLDEYTGEKL